VHGGQSRVGSQVGQLVFQRLRGRRTRGGIRLKGVDLGPQRRDLAAVARVDPLELLDAPHQGLIAGELVGRREELRPHLAREHEAGGQGDERDQRDADEGGDESSRQFCLDHP